ncbi:MAG: putative oxidoreductase [Hyphomicrobiaceae bacterium]|jgi:putative oxidoreductase
MIQMLSRLYENVFATIQALLENWFLGLAARLMFSSVLFWYFINSAMTKVGSGFPGMFVVKDNTYAQMFPKLFESVGFDASQISFIPYGIIAYAGTYAEFILPVLILLGLFTRAAAAGFMGFLAVMTLTDITGHDAKIGGFFDRFQDAAIADQRLLWLFPLIYLLIRGPGLVSLDAVFGRMFRR